MSETIDSEDRPKVTDSLELATELMETVIKNSVRKDRVQPTPLITRGSKSTRINIKTSKRV